MSEEPKTYRVVNFDPDGTEKIYELDEWRFQQFPTVKDTPVMGSEEEGDVFFFPKVASSEIIDRLLEYLRAVQECPERKEKYEQEKQRIIDQMKRENEDFAAGNDDDADTNNEVAEVDEDDDSDEKPKNQVEKTDSNSMQEDEKSKLPWQPWEGAILSPLFTCDDPTNVERKTDPPGVMALKFCDATFCYVPLHLLAAMFAWTYADVVEKGGMEMACKYVDVEPITEQEMEAIKKALKKEADMEWVEDEEDKETKIIDVDKFVSEAASSSSAAPPA